METPPTPPAPAVILNDLIEILPDDIKIDEDLEFKSLDDSQMEIPIMDYIPQSVQDEEVDEAPVPFFAVEEKPLFRQKGSLVLKIGLVSFLCLHNR